MTDPTDDHDLLKHEAQDRTFMLQTILDEHVQSHPFITQRPDLYARAETAMTALGDLYQAIDRAASGDTEI